MSNLKTLFYYIKPHHACFNQAKKEAVMAKLMKNGITAIARNYFFWKRQGNAADLSISRDFGIDITQEDYDKKTGELAGRDWFNYSANRFSAVEIYGNVRRVKTPELHSKIAQKIARDSSGDWRSYWALQKAFKQGKITTRPKIPNYNKGLYATVPYVKGMLRVPDLKNKIVKPTTWSSGFELPSYVVPSSVQSARLIPISKDLFRFEVLYECEWGNDTRKKLNSEELTVGIDLGLSNLMTVVYSDYRPGHIVSGAPVIGVLQSCNYKVDRMSGFYKSEDNNRLRNGGEKTRDRNYSFLNNVRDKTRRTVKSYYTAVTNRLVEEFCEAGVDRVVVGWSDGFKKSMNTGKLNNRKFMGVPHRLIVDDLKRKCVEVGIDFVETEESYTSKSSFFDNDILPVYEKSNGAKYSFSGRRVSRGLYRTALGYCVSADMNGAFLIL